MFSRFFEKSDLPPTEEELQLRKKRQRRLVIIGAAILVVLVAGYFSARPVLHAVRAWQARRHAEKAYQFMEQEKWNEARTEAFAAYQLRSTEPEAIRALARLFSRAGQADALKFWKDLAAQTPLTRDDLRDEAGLALKTKELDVAEEAIKALTDKRKGGPAPADWLLAAQLALQKQDYDLATLHIRNIFAGNSASDRERFQGTMLLDSIARARAGKGEDEVLQRLAALARGKESVSLDALVALGQHYLASNAPWPESAKMSVDDMVRALESHPLAKTQHKLLAVDLKIHQHPDQREEFLQGAIAQWKDADDAALLALAGWLNSRGEHQRELDTIPRARAMQTRELFFQHVDALGALGRWDEIRRLIESEQFPLDPVIEHMYLARCFAQQGQTNGAENNWSRALQAAAGDAGKLMVLGDYAEKNGAFDVALAAFEAAVAVQPKSRVAQQGRLRVAYALRDTKKIHAILQDLLKIWPNDTAVQNDEAYARLLLMPSQQSTLNSQPSTSPSPGSVLPAATSELVAIERLAEKLVQREPASLPHRTVLALARLKQNRATEAIEVYQNINVPANSLTTSSIAVHAAVLAATGHRDEARTEFSKLPTDKLLPEERLLDPDNKN